MNKRPLHIIDVFIHGCIVIVLCGAMYLIWSAYKHLKKQLNEDAIELVDGVLFDARRELDRTRKRVSKELDQVLDLVDQFDDPFKNDSALMTLLAPELRHSRSSRSIRVSSINGQDVQLFLRDSTICARKRVPASTHAVVEEKCWHNAVLEPRWRVPALPVTEIKDPRSTNWFSNALESNSDRAVWTYFEPLELRNGYFVVAKKARRHTINGGLCIVSIQIDLDELLSALYELPANLGGTAFLLNKDGDLLKPLDTYRTSTLRDSTMGEAHDLWKVQQTTEALAFFHGDRVYWTRVEPFDLNGYQVMTGAVVPIGEINWVNRQWRLVLFALLLTLAMVILLVWAYLRRRKVAKHLQLQTVRSRSQQRKLARALGEREVLDREVHHWVKNNLQVISSLLSLQANKITDDRTMQVFDQSRQRIESMALVHHNLYNTKDMRGIDLQSYFEGLATNLSQRHAPPDTPVSFEVNARHIKADPDSAIELGMIFCELVTNCFKHAFPFATGGHVNIDLERVATGQFKLTVKDNGQGLKSDMLNAGNGNLGLEIVEALADELDGNFTYHSNGGVSFEVKFRMVENNATPV